MAQGQSVALVLRKSSAQMGNVRAAFFLPFLLLNVINGIRLRASRKTAASSTTVVVFVLRDQSLRHVLRGHIPHSVPYTQLNWQSLIHSHI